MNRQRKPIPVSSSGRFVRKPKSKSIGRNARLRLSYELLEQRYLLSADLGPVTLDAPNSNQSSIAPLTWFESFSTVNRIPLESLANVDPSLPAGVMGPLPGAVGEWIVQLNKATTDTVRQLAAADSLLDDANDDFTIISGLGSPGSILVRGQGVSKADIEASLAHNSAVESFSLNQLITGQQTLANDPEFVGGLLPGLEKVDAKNAWDVSRGSLSTVVGVLDSGIDPTHPDLYLNIWINQGELPAKYLDAVGPKLTDIDGDGLITFYDLNNVKRAATAPYVLTFSGFATGPNASFVHDLNNNGRIDAIDLLQDANWADGRDTDNNGFFDDFFGVNFRAGAGDAYESNNPSDVVGHGTHVAGTIGAIGGNATGVVGVNWQTSLMSLRILDEHNQGDSGAAIRAVNYAREMRERYRVDAAGRVTAGANVRVLNNSWGQPGGYELSLQTAIQDSYEAGILFVAAAGNGNILGNGVDNDRTPFYPASYNVPSVIAVAASDSSDRPAAFSNFGKTTVDLFAPGVGVRSTLPGGGYGSANGTSMASPHVAGTAALIWAALPEATVDEVKQAILSTVDPIPNGANLVSSAGRLNAAKAINANVFAPSARVTAKQDITTAGGTSTEFTVQYTYRSGINTTTLGNDDLIVTRQWGPADQLTATLKPGSIKSTATTATATYIVAAPGGKWDALDFGDYVVSTVAGKVTSKTGNQPIQAREVGRFNVRINDPSVLYVNTFADSLEPGTLRSAIIAANAAAPASRTIILDSGKYTIDIPRVVDSTSTFGSSLVAIGIPNPGGWSNATSGDFDIQGNIAIVGNVNDDVVIDGQGLDRVFKVHANSTLTLSRLTVQGGNSPPTQGGGGILSIGNLILDQAILKKNIALGTDALPIFGGAIASWSGKTSFDQSWITENQSDFGGGLYYGNTAITSVQRSTFDNNKGGAIYSSSSSNGNVENTTFSANTGGYGAIVNGIQNGFLVANGYSFSPSQSADGRFVVFRSYASNLVPSDTNNFDDIFIYDRTTNLFERAGAGYSPSISGDGRYVTFNDYLPGGNTNEYRYEVRVYDRILKSTEHLSLNLTANKGIFDRSPPSLSADGRFVAFNDYDPGDTQSQFRHQVYVYDRTLKSVERVSFNKTGIQGDGDSSRPSLSADGRYVTFQSDAKNLVPGDTNLKTDVFVYDRTTKSLERVSVNKTGVEGDGNSFSSTPSLSTDGRYVTFVSDATNLVLDDMNRKSDVFVYDRTMKSVERVSVNKTGLEGDGNSSSPSLSADGRYVSFQSDATNLFTGDTNLAPDIFVYDRSMKSIERISIGDPPTDFPTYYPTYSPTLSADGRFVTFYSVVSNLAAGDTNETSDIFVYDRTTKLIQPITFVPIKSAIDVNNCTIAFTSDGTLETAVYGDVTLSNSLFLANKGTTDINSRFPSASSHNNIFSSIPQSNLVSPLQRTGTFPPVHQLIEGNPAIDSATSTSNGTRDQLGTIRVLADIGAVEAITAKVSGKVYVDANRNGQLDLDEGEQGISGVIVNVTGAPNLAITSQNDRLQTPLVNESGSLDVTEVPFGIHNFIAQVGPGWSPYTIPLEIIDNASIPGNFNSDAPSWSADGRYVTFRSDANNLVPGDNNNTSDIFVFDRITKVIERVSISAGVEANGYSEWPSLSADGRYVTFQSTASNLAPGNYNGSFRNIFLYDRKTKLIELVNVNSFGEQMNGTSKRSSLSADGRYVTFESNASDSATPNQQFDIYVHDRKTKLTEQVGAYFPHPTNSGSGSFSPSLSADGRYVTFYSDSQYLVPGASGGNIFVFDLTTKLIELVSVSNTGAQGHGFASSLSKDGRYAAFYSNSSDLVPGDTNSASDIFVYDRTTKSIDRVKANRVGLYFDDSIKAPSMSEDGRFITFESDANDLVPGDTNGKTDIFVYDRTTKKTVRASVNATGIEANGFSVSPSLSADGRYVTFASNATNLVDGNTNGIGKIYIVPNPLATTNLAVDLKAGEVYINLNIGLIPDPGTISGRVFEDTVANNAYDIGEPLISKAVVFLDSNSNGVLDEGETSVVADSNGQYKFLKTDSYRSYTIAVNAPIGFEQVAPAAKDDFAWKFFLPAGGVITDRDFSFRHVKPTGQSESSAVSGRLYDDRNGNGVFDAGVDTPIANREVYLDATNFGVRDAKETRVLTDDQGMYLLDHLGSLTAAVTPTLDNTLEVVSPLGNQFSRQKFPLFSSITPFSGVQAIATGLFNQDEFSDVAVALGEGNTLSIRLNDGNGGFLPDQINFDLGDGGAGPKALVVGQFDGNPQLDVALTASNSSNVTVLLNFDSVTKKFASRSYVKVGLNPLDIVAGQFNGDSNFDLAVVNQGDNSVQLLINNGSGVFTAATAVSTGGKDPVSLVAGNFTGDAVLDLAVIHLTPLTTTTPFGGVTVLKGNTAGVLTLQPSYYEVGASPIDAATADFNKDGRPDLVVANSESTSLSVLLGQADGTFKVQTTILGTPKGAIDITVADIDNDDDIDVIVSNLTDQKISIFRNIGINDNSKEVQFEPLENIGQADSNVSNRMPLAVANFDNDVSGPGGRGTIDIVAVPVQTDELNVLKNKLVNGTHRVELTGASTDSITGMDFIIKSSVLPPAFDVISDPSPIVENAGEQLLNITGVTKGRTDGPALKFTATSSVSALIASPTVAFVAGSNTATVHYTPTANASGTTVVTVRAVDAGADKAFDTADDGVLERSFTVTVLELTSIVLDGANETFDLTTSPNSVLENIGMIDIRGTGNNTLVVDAGKINRLTPAQTLHVISNAGDTIKFGTGWVANRPAFINGTFTHIITGTVAVATTGAASGEAGTARVELLNDRFFQNPLNRYDVSRDGKIQVIDALQVLNEVRRRNGAPIAVPTKDAEISSSYFDVDGSNTIGVVDALQVLNAIARISRGGSAEGESRLQTVDLNQFVRQDSLSEKASTKTWDEPIVDAPRKLLVVDTAAVDDFMQELGSDGLGFDSPQKSTKDAKEDLIELLKPELVEG